MATEEVIGALAPTGVLRAAVNLGNSVLAQGTPQSPSGVTVDLAREIAARIDRSVSFVCFDAARKSFDAIIRGETDICFLAIEPDREKEVVFSSPYTVIDGVYVVGPESRLWTVDDVDSPGIRIGVKRGSAYDLFLSRTLSHASVVRGDEGVDCYLADELEAGAGIRGSVEQFVTAHPGHRLIEEAFMEIQQAVGVARSCPSSAVSFVNAVVEELVADGSVAASLMRSGQTSARVADSRRS